MEKAARINPNYHNENYTKGEEYLRRNDYERAYFEFEKGHTKTTQSADLSFILDFYLRVIHKGKDLKNAVILRHINKLEEMMKKYPSYADLYNHLGVAYIIMSKFHNNQAIGLFNKAMDINPNFEKAKKNKRLAEYDHKGIQLLFDAILK